MKNYKAVIFDLDGLLIDSERIGAENAVAVAERMNVPITRDIVIHTLGMTEKDTYDYYRLFLPDDQRLTEYMNEEGRILNQMILDGRIPLKKGAARLLKHVHDRGLKMAIASSSSANYIRNTLRPSGSLGYFSVIVSSDDITKGKPDPEAFLKAAEKLGEKPEDCLVLEDSLHGLHAAINGGFDCLVVPDLISYSEEQIAKATYFLPDLDEVVERGLI